MDLVTLTIMGLRSLFTFKKHHEPESSTKSEEKTAKLTGLQASSALGVSTPMGPEIKQVAPVTQLNPSVAITDTFPVSHESHAHIPAPLIRSPRPGVVVQAVATVYYRVLRANAGFFDAEGHLRTDIPVPRERNQSLLSVFQEPCQPTDYDSVLRLLRRTAFRLRVHDETTVSSLVLLDRLVACSSCVLGPCNWRRILLTLMTTAQTGTDDQFYTAEGMSGTIPGLTAREMRAMQYVLLTLLDHRIIIPLDQWNAYVRKLARLQGVTVKQLGLSSPPDPSPDLLSPCFLGVEDQENFNEVMREKRCLKPRE